MPKFSAEFEFRPDASISLAKGSCGEGLAEVEWLPSALELEAAEEFPLLSRLLGHAMPDSPITTSEAPDDRGLTAEELVVREGLPNLGCAEPPPPDFDISSSYET